MRLFFEAIVDTLMRALSVVRMLVSEGGGSARGTSGTPGSLLIT